MPTNKRNKNSRQRGSHTHGWGAMKKHRGAGHRGGRGRSGSGKRGDAMKPFFRVKLGFEIGRNGFGKRRVKISSMNISELQEKINNLVKSGIMKQKNNSYAIDMSHIKIDKLLGTGDAKHKFEIKVKYASKSAIEKIEKAGGKVTVPDKKLEENLSKKNEKKSSGKDASEEQ